MNISLRRRSRASAVSSPEETVRGDLKGVVGHLDHAARELALAGKIVREQTGSVGAEGVLSLEVSDVAHRIRDLDPPLRVVSEDRDASSQAPVGRPIDVLLGHLDAAHRVLKAAAKDTPLPEKTRGERGVLAEEVFDVTHRVEGVADSRRRECDTETGQFFEVSAEAEAPPHGFLDRLLGSQTVAGAAPESEPMDADQAGRAVAEAQLKRFSAVSERLLSRADVTAKAAAGLGSTGLTAIGIAKVADVYPHAGPDGWLVGLFGGFLAMGFAVAFFTRRLWQLHTPTVMRSTPWEIRDLDDEEQKLVTEVYAEIAKLNDVASLRAYEARAHRLSRVARVLGETPLRKALGAEASVISLEVRATLARARLNVIRRRTTRSLLGARAMLVYFAFLAGLVLFGVAADALEAKRSGETQIAKTCGEALKAGASSLPSSCDAYVPPDSAREAKAPGDEIDTAAEQLAAQRTACRRAARKMGEDPSASCAEIDRALSALTATR